MDMGYQGKGDGKGGGKPNEGNVCFQIKLQMMIQVVTYISILINDQIMFEVSN